MPTYPPEPFMKIFANAHLKIDNRYATENNFTQKPLPGYYKPDLWLHKDAYTQVQQALDTVIKMGLTLIVWDAYRPYRATKAMVEWTKRTNQVHLVEEGYIARRSRHNSGIAIDLSLMCNGEYLDMGTEWDDFSEKSHILNADGEVLKNRMLLQGIMRQHGFIGYSKEWWHFQLPNAASYPFRDIPYHPEETKEEPNFSAKLQLGEIA